MAVVCVLLVLFAGTVQGVHGHIGCPDPHRSVHGAHILASTGASTPARSPARLHATARFRKTAAGRQRPSAGSRQC